MATSHSTHTRHHPRADLARHGTGTGLTIAALGIVLFNVAPFLDWVSVEADGIEVAQRTGYETDSLVPFMAYLGAGLLFAMIYAAMRSPRGQRRGLTLTAMAVGLAATLQCIAFAIEPMRGVALGADLVAQSGVYLGIVAASLWAIGCGLMSRAAELEESHDHDHRDQHGHGPRDGSHEAL